MADNYIEKLFDGDGVLDTARCVSFMKDLVFLSDVKEGISRNKYIIVMENVPNVFKGTLDEEIWKGLLTGKTMNDNSVVYSVGVIQSISIGNAQGAESEPRTLKITSSRLLFLISDDPSKLAPRDIFLTYSRSIEIGFPLSPLKVTDIASVNDVNDVFLLGHLSELAVSATSEIVTLGKAFNKEKIYYRGGTDANGLSYKDENLGAIECIFDFLSVNEDEGIMHIKLHTSSMTSYEENCFCSTGILPVTAIEDTETGRTAFTDYLLLLQKVHKIDTLIKKKPNNEEYVITEDGVKNIVKIPEYRFNDIRNTLKGNSARSIEYGIKPEDVEGFSKLTGIDVEEIKSVLPKAQKSDVPPKPSPPKTEPKPAQKPAPTPAPTPAQKPAQKPAPSPQPSKTGTEGASSKKGSTDDDDDAKRKAEIKRQEEEYKQKLEKETEQMEEMKRQIAKKIQEEKEREEGERKQKEELEKKLKKTEEEQRRQEEERKKIDEQKAELKRLEEEAEAARRRAETLKIEADEKRKKEEEDMKKLADELKKLGEGFNAKPKPDEQQEEHQEPPEDQDEVNDKMKDLLPGSGHNSDNDELKGQGNKGEGQEEPNDNPDVDVPDVGEGQFEHPNSSSEDENEEETQEGKTSKKKFLKPKPGSEKMETKKKKNPYRAVPMREILAQIKYDTLLDTRYCEAIDGVMHPQDGVNFRSYIGTLAAITSLESFKKNPSKFIIFSGGAIFIEGITAETIRRIDKNSIHQNSAFLGIWFNGNHGKLTISNWVPVEYKALNYGGIILKEEMDYSLGLIGSAGDVKANDFHSAFKPVVGSLQYTSVFEDGFASMMDSIEVRKVDIRLALQIEDVLDISVSFRMFGHVLTMNTSDLKNRTYNTVNQIAMEKHWEFTDGIYPVHIKIGIPFFVSANSDSIRLTPSSINVRVQKVSRIESWLIESNENKTSISDYDRIRTDLNNIKRMLRRGKNGYPSDKKLYDLEKRVEDLSELLMKGSEDTENLKGINEQANQSIAEILKDIRGYTQSNK